MKIASELSIVNLDANASVPPLPEAVRALTAAIALEGNASSTHSLGRKLRVVLDEARERVAAALGGRENELFFCSGASEGNRWVVDSLIRTGEMRGSPLLVLTSPFEHPSMAKCLDAAAKQGKMELQRLPLENGILQVDPKLLERAEAVVISAAHNETGYLPDLAGLGLNKEATLISDASQAVGRIGTLSPRVDVIIASAHKMGGVVGAGAVLVRGQGQKLSAPWVGGGQEAGLRPGTESVPLIAAMGAASLHIEETRRKSQGLSQIRDAIEAELVAAWEGAFVVGSNGLRLPQTSAICVNRIDPEALRIAVDQAGICIGFGSACSALAPEPSPALLAFGLSQTQARATIRISLHAGLSEDQVRAGAGRLKDLVSGMLVAR